MLDAMNNPYNPGAGSPPPALVGRDMELHHFDVSVQRLLRGRSDRSQMLLGLRGVGKTVLLRKFAGIAEGYDWKCHHLECTESTDLVQAAANLVRAAVLDLSTGSRLAEWAARALGVLRSFQVTWEVPGGGTMKIGSDSGPVAGRADSGDLSRDLSDLFRALGELARDKKTGVLFTIDEIQYLPTTRLTPLLVALHEVSQMQLPLLVTGAGLPSTRGMLSEARTYSERLFTFVSMDSLSADAATEALVKPAQSEGVQWDEAALATVFKATGGYPYFLQEFGKQSWRVADSADRIDQEDVLRAVPLVLDELDEGFFSLRVERATRAERAYIAAMASLGAGPYRSGGIAETLGRTTQQLSTIRDSLIKRGICFAPGRDVIDFTVPMFDDFVRRRLEDHY